MWSPKSDLLQALDLGKSLNLSASFLSAKGKQLVTLTGIEVLFVLRV